MSAEKDPESVPRDVPQEINPVAEHPTEEQAAEHDLSGCTTLVEASRTISRTQWQWKNWLPFGYISLLVGYPGEGKSYLALEVAALMLEGGNWPDGQPCPRINHVMWVDTEGTQALLLERAEKREIPQDRVLFPSREPLADFYLDNPLQREELLQRVLEARPGLVVIDTLRGAYRGEENSSDTVSPLLKEIQKIARSGKMAVLVCHHLKKPSDFPGAIEITMHSIRGSSAIPAAARVVWAIDNPPGPMNCSGIKRLRVIKSNLSGIPEPLGFTVDGNGIHWRSLPPDSKRPGAVENAVDYLKRKLLDGPRPSVEAVEEASQLGISKAALERAKVIIGIEVSKESGEKGRWFWALPRLKSVSE